MIAERPTTAFEAARLRRLAMFTTQIERQLTRYLREKEVSTSKVDEYVNEILARMMDSDEPFPTMQLLGMLAAPYMGEDVIRGYNKKLRESRK